MPRNNVGEQRSRRIGGVQSSVMTCLTALPLLFLLLSFIFVQSTLSLDFKGGNSKTYSQCEKCKIVVDSFKEGLKRTARGKHEGGDAHWEEKKLSNYANSEIRLTEIQENLCHEVSLGKDQCHSFAEEFESALEEWFFQHLKKERVDQIDEGSSLFDHLCNDVASACCPEGHYGPSCTPCQGYPEQVCNGRGYCAGNGTREGKGNCKCFRGYGGKQCEKCAKSYFDAEATESSGDSANQIPKICQRCDRSCASSCHSSGPRGCHVCGKGYTWDQETGCIDVNECSELEVNPCTESTYCSNTVGSFKCLQCNKACKGCSGPGDNMCLKCSENFELIGERCSSKFEPDWTQMWPLYLSYLFLLVTSIGILRSSPSIGCLVSLITIAFIGIFEFGLNHNSQIASYVKKFYYKHI